MRRPTDSRALLLVLGLLACSSAEPPTPAHDECGTHADCPEAEVCGPAGVCIPASDVPPRAYLAFDIQESLGAQPQFRAEVFGCDEEFLEVQRQDQILELARPVVAQNLQLSVVSVDEAGDTAPLAATFELSQASRFARPPGLRRTVVHELPESDMPIETSVAWPRYRPENRQPNPQLAEGGFILWTITPRSIEEELESIDRAPMLAMLTPPVVRDDAPCSHDDMCEETERCVYVPWQSARACRPTRNPNMRYQDIRYATACESRVRGRAVWLTAELERGDPIVGVNIGVRYGADPEEGRFGIPATANEPLDERAPQCASDADCLPGSQFCDESSAQCFLNLEGRVANSTSIEGLVTSDGQHPSLAPGQFSTRVYTYCEGAATGPLRRHYLVNVSDRDPDRMADRVVPSINYGAEVVFPPPQGPDDPLVGDVAGSLCVPDWGPPQSLRIELAGDPVTLTGAGDGAYRCCDIQCLPREADDAEVPPSPEIACSGRTVQPTLRLEAPLTLSPQDIEDWREAGCATPRSIDEDPRVVGSLVRAARCFDDATYCEATGLAAGPDGGSRAYRLRLETPQGSLFRSVDLDLEVDATTADLEIALQRRVLVRGRVTLPSAICELEGDDDCGSEAATVMAERLRMPDEERRPAGPYFHQVATYFDPGRGSRGHYVLPLDPGVWVLTALPERGAMGGPARYAVLDLRDEIDREQLDFVLELGSVVSLELPAFDVRTTVAPLDAGSWLEERLEHPGRLELPEPARFIDLSTIGECWGEEAQACRIRRLFPGGPLPISQTGEIHFSARLAPASPNAGRDCLPR
jgi:hypothetical protein